MNDAEYFIVKPGDMKSTHGRSDVQLTAQGNKKRNNFRDKKRVVLL